MLEQAAADLAGTLPSAPGPLASYRNRPSSFARDMIQWPAGKRLAAYQAEALDALAEHGRLALRGPHTLGKSSTASIALLWFALTRDELGIDWKAPVTASVWLQLTAYFWPEVHKWARMLDWDAMGRKPLDERKELLTLNLKLRYGEAFSASPSEATAIEGAHATSLFYIFDEAKAIPEDVWDATEGAFAGAGPDTESEAFALAISTPGEPQGRFFQIHKRSAGTEDWKVRHVTKDEAVAAGRMSEQWASDRERQWGVGSALYKNRVLGDFATSDTDGVIPLEWVEAAQRRWVEAYGQSGERFAMPIVEALGVDCSGTGADRTVLARRHGVVVAALERPRKSAPEANAIDNVGEEEMATAGRVVGILKAQKGCVAIIDGIGNGAGVVGSVRAQVGRKQTHPFIASASAHGKKDKSGELGFADLRSAAWWHLREMLDPDGGVDLLLPPDDELVGDLTAPHWRVLSGGRIKVESKDDIRGRLNRSTDAGDAVVQVCWSPGSGSTSTASTAGAASIPNRAPAVPGGGRGRAAAQVIVPRR